MSGNSDQAVQALADAIAAGYARLAGSPEAVEQDPAFVSLLTRTDFQALVSELGDGRQSFDPGSGK